MSQRTPLFRKQNGESYMIPFLLVITLFALWGFALGLMDVLNNHFTDLLNLSGKVHGSLIRVAYFAGYLIMPLPAAMFLKKFGYKKGIILGLSIYAIGAILFYPAAEIREFWAFFVALFGISLGMAFLETAANPYAVVMGNRKVAAARLTFAQSFTGVGWILGPLVGSVILMDIQAVGGNPFATISIPYAGVGILVVMVAILVLVIKIPEIDEAKTEQVEHTIQEVEKGSKHYKSVFQYKHFLWSVIALLTYLVAQFGITGFFVTYIVDTLKSMKDVGSETLIGMIHFFDSSIDLTDSANYNKAAVVLLSMVSMGLFMLGRFLGSLLLLKIKPQKLLCMSAEISIVLTGLVVANNGMLAIASLIALFLFMSSMFPIIFTLGLKDLGAHTKKASAYLVMTIGGAAFLAFTCMDYVNIITGTSNYSFIIPFVCFIVVFIYGRFGYKTEI